MQVVVNLDRTAADLLSEFSAGAKIYLESAATENGSYSVVGSGTALVSGTERYEIYDTAGTPGTTWYKFRVGNSGGSLYTAYSTSWLSTSLVAYATLDDLRETMDFPDTSRDNLLTDLLTDVSADIDAVCQRRFYRDPQVTGTTTVYADVMYSGLASLEDAIGRATLADGRALDIVSITTLSVRESESSAYVEVAAGDTGYYLDGWSIGVGVFGTDWAYEDVSLSPAGTYATFPTGKRAVKIVGVFGFPTVPAPIKRAVISEGRERYRQAVGGGPAQQGVNQFGTPIFLTGDSPDMRRITRAPFSRRKLVA